MITYKLIVKTRDTGIYKFDDVSFSVKDNMLIVNDCPTTKCFPLENIIYYEFEKARR